MVLYISENEMCERYIDSLKKAASHADEFVKNESNNKIELFLDFLDSIKISAGSAHQLAHAQENPKWLDIRDILEGIMEVGKSIPMMKGDDRPIWSRINKSLLDMISAGDKIFNMKGMTRKDVLANLDHRFKSLGELDGRPN